MELLVRLVDKAPAEDASKRGDVISVCDDGWAWSVEERTNPAWIIIKVVSLLGTDRDAMVSTAQFFPLGRFRRREWFLDFSQAPLPGRFDYPRTQESVTMTRLGVIAILTQKPALV